MRKKELTFLLGGIEMRSSKLRILNKKSCDVGWILKRKNLGGITKHLFKHLMVLRCTVSNSGMGRREWNNHVNIYNNLLKHGPLIDLFIPGWLLGWILYRKNLAEFRNHLLIYFNYLRSDGGWMNFI